MRRTRRSGTRFAAPISQRRSELRTTLPASLKRFDDWYFAFYPYLFIHVPFDEFKGADVLEAGLGYGTVSQRIAEAGARYFGLDIAPGPVWMANHRLQQAGLPGQARQGSILATDFADQTFDFIVAIGCLHHTGDLPRAILECQDPAAGRQAGFHGLLRLLVSAILPGPEGKRYGTPFGSCWAIAASWRHEPAANAWLTMPMPPEKPLRIQISFLAAPCATCAAGSPAFRPRRRISTRASRSQVAHPGASS